MILTIFGAGASFDSSPSKPASQYARAQLQERMPLTNELFRDEWIFSAGRMRFPAIRPLIHHLYRASDGVEVLLQRYRDESADDPERRRQLMAIRFYLQYVIFENERHWTSVHRGATNYSMLLDVLRKYSSPKEPSLLVTFNYDTMLESAMADLGHRIASLDDYIHGDTIKLFKPHGSINWAHDVEIDEIIRVGGGDDAGFELSQLVIDKAAGDLRSSKSFRFVTRTPLGAVNNNVLMPALAIPVREKQEFECPDEHLECLREQLPKVSKVIVIGWRAAEEHFLAILAEHLPRTTRMCLICGSKDEGDGASQRLLNAGVPVKCEVLGMGFTPYIEGKQAEAFLAS